MRLHHLVGGLVAIFNFPIYWVANHPNWRSYFSEGWPNHQPVICFKIRYPPKPMINHHWPPVRRAFSTVFLPIFRHKITRKNKQGTSNVALSVWSLGRLGLQRAVGSELKQATMALSAHSCSNSFSWVDAGWVCLIFFGNPIFPLC